MTDEKSSRSGSSLPFPKWWPIVAGALTGVVLRIAFYGEPGEPWSAMMGSFIYLAPIAATVITALVAERRQQRTLGYHVVAGMLANVLLVLGTLMILIEGLICAIVILPLFAALGALGALIMWCAFRITGWPKQIAGCVVVLPLIAGAIEPPTGQPQVVRHIERTLTIHAPREIVWAQLANVRDIRAEEVEDTLAFRIGVPPPVSALTEQHDGKRVRRVSMGKRVYFDQEEVERREIEYIRWVQRFYPDSFPPGSFDQHVVMGGDYFDIHDVAYTLVPEGESTRLTIAMRYRVSTRFNWYADGVARIVLGNLEETLLQVYASRALAAPIDTPGENNGLEHGV